MFEYFLRRFKSAVSIFFAVKSTIILVILSVNFGRILIILLDEFIMSFHGNVFSFKGSVFSWNFPGINHIVEKR